MSYRVPPDPPPPTLVKVDPRLINWLDLMQGAVFGIMMGNMNVSGITPLTLTPGATTTTIMDPRIGGTTVILLQPMTANAAAALATTWVSVPLKGSVVINHANSAQVDRTFNYIMIG